MEKLPKDIIISIVLELSPKDLFHFCKTCKKNNVLDTKSFWLRKLQKEYGPFEIIVENPKEIYKQKYLRIRKGINGIVEYFLDNVFGYFQNYLSPVYKKEVYTIFLGTYEILISDAKKGIDVIDKHEENAYSEYFEEYYNYREFISSFTFDQLPIPDMCELADIPDNILTKIYKLARIKYVGY